MLDTANPEQDLALNALNRRRRTPPSTQCRKGRRAPCRFRTAQSSPGGDIPDRPQGGNPEGPEHRPVQALLAYVHGIRGPLFALSAALPGR